MNLVGNHKTSNRGIQKPQVGSRPLIIKPQRGKSTPHNGLKGKKLEPLVAPSSKSPTKKESNLNSNLPPPKTFSTQNYISSTQDKPIEEQGLFDEEDPMLNGPVSMFVCDDSLDNDPVGNTSNDESRFSKKVPALPDLSQEEEFPDAQFFD